MEIVQHKLIDDRRKLHEHLNLSQESCDKKSLGIVVVSTRELTDWLSLSSRELSLSANWILTLQTVQQMEFKLIIFKSISW